MKTSRLLMIPLAAVALSLAACSSRHPSGNSTEENSKPEHSVTESVPGVNTDDKTEVAPGTSEDNTTEDQTTETTRPERPAGGYMKEKVSIELWHSFGSPEAPLESMVKSFQEAEPNITVNVTKKTGGYDQLRNDIINGIPTNNYPDIAICYPDHVADYYDYGVAARIDTPELMNNPTFGWDESKHDDIMDFYWKECNNYDKEGGVYSLPFAKSSEVMYYNASVLLNLPELPGIGKINEKYINNLTWEELFDNLCPALEKLNNDLPDAKKFYKPGEEVYKGFVGHESDANFFITLAEQYGYDYTVKNADGSGTPVFDNPEMKALMKKFKGYYDKGYFFTKGTAEGKFLNGLFGKNAILFDIGSTAGASHIDDAETLDIRVAPLPRAGVANAKDAIISQGPSLCILDHSNLAQKQAAWLLYDFITEQENIAKWAIDTSYLPFTYSVGESTLWQKHVDADSLEGKQKLIAQTAMLVDKYYERECLFTSPVFKGSAGCRVRVDGLVVQCMLSDDIDGKIDQLFSEALNKANSDIAS